ncbi:MAG: DHA2 family efflux MFS transporter permease subunit [Acidimicrobiia bacterium]|nr:DHA2 family efflux MFS transporter permease subunit [Acidimicrobiia bacterium]
MLSQRVSQKVAVGAVYVAALFMTIMDSTIVNVTLPAMGHEFGVASAAVNGVVIYYLVALAAAIPVSGWLGDRFGGRRVLLGAILLFVVASALCGAAQSLSQLELLRVLQGVAGGLMTPVGMAMLWRVFPPAERARAAAILVIPTAIAPALGPVLGGYFVTYMSWRWVFYVNVPIGLVAVVFGLLFLAEQRLDDAGAFDLAGFVLAGSGLGLLMFGLSKGPIDGWTDPAIVATCLAGAVLLVVLVAVELRRAEPLLKLRLLAARLFGLCNAVMILGVIGFLGTIFVVSLFYQDGLGLNALQAGLSIFPEALGVMAGSQLVAKVLYPRFGPRRILFGGLMLAAAMMLALTSVGAQTSLWVPRSILFCMGFGMSALFIAVQTAAFANTSHDDMGAASTLLNTQQQLGGAIGVAILTTVFVAAGPVTPAGGGPVPDLSAYRVAFVTAAAFAVLAACVALFIHDSDAASTITPSPDRAREAGR